MSAKAKNRLTPQQRKATLTRVLGKIKPYSLFVVCSLVVAAVSVGAQLYIPILCGSAIDLMLGKGTVDFGGVMCIMIEVLVVAAAAALRSFLGWGCTAGGYFLTPAAGPDSRAAGTLAPLLAAAAARQEQLARGRVRWAVVECAAEEVLPLYLRQGFALRAIRPLDSLAPCFWLQAGCLGQNQPPVWVPLADRVHIAILLARGYAALESRESPQGTVLALYPV